MAAAIGAMMTPMAASPGKSVVGCERERRKKAYGKECLKRLSHDPYK
jgi:hypothetical protein